MKDKVREAVAKKDGVIRRALPNIIHIHKFCLQLNIRCLVWQPLSALNENALQAKVTDQGRERGQHLCVVVTMANVLWYLTSMVCANPSL